MVSIILPVYNGSRYLSFAIESILTQSYTDFELIIVDDCSADNTYEIAQEYASKDSRIRIIQNESNKRLPASLNIGFRVSHGDYVTWTSDDNIYYSDAIKEMVAYLDSHADKAIVYTDMEIIDEDGRETGEYIYGTGDEKEIFCRNIIGACFVYRREVQEFLKGYSVTEYLVEDYDFWLRASEHFSIGYLKGIYYQYRVHGESLTATKKEEVYRKDVQLWKRAYRYCPEKYRTQMLRNMLYFSFLTNDDKTYRKAIKIMKKKYMDDYKKLELKYRFIEFFGCGFSLKVRKALKKVKPNRTPQ